MRKGEGRYRMRNGGGSERKGRRKGIGIEGDR